MVQTASDMRKKLSIVFLTVACMSVALAWLTSYPAARYFPSAPANGGWRVESTDGRLVIYRFASPQSGLMPLKDSPNAWQPSPWSGRSIKHPFLFGQVVFQRGAFWTASSTTTHAALHIHYFLLALVFGSLSIAQSIRLWQIHRRQRALAHGRCAVCGYDLRASPERCPECGAVPEAIPRTAERAQ